MTLEILSPERTLFSGEVESVTLPGTLGEFTVLRHHAPLISSLTAGEVRFRQKGGGEQRLKRTRFRSASSNKRHRNRDIPAPPA